MFRAQESMVLCVGARLSAVVIVLIFRLHGKRYFSVFSRCSAELKLTYVSFRDLSLNLCCKVWSLVLPPMRIDGECLSFSGAEHHWS